jgi:elongation factor P
LPFFKSPNKKPYFELDLQYLYNDGSQWNFMDPDSFEQYAIDDSAMDDAKGYLVEQDMCVVTLWSRAFESHC